MTIEKFEDSIAWQKAKILTIEIYTILRETKDYGYRDQIQRAAVSIMNKIAEGFERRSNKEMKQFLFISKLDLRKNPTTSCPLPVSISQFSLVNGATAPSPQEKQASGSSVFDSEASAILRKSSKGLCGEVRPMLDLGGGLGYFFEEQTVNLIAISLEISKMLSGQIKQL